MMFTPTENLAVGVHDDEEQGRALPVLANASGETVIKVVEEVVPTVTNPRSEKSAIRPFEPFQRSGVIAREEL